MATRHGGPQPPGEVVRPQVEQDTYPHERHTLNANPEVARRRLPKLLDFLTSLDDQALQVRRLGRQFSRLASRSDGIARSGKVG